MTPLEGPIRREEEELPDDHWNRLFTDQDYFTEFTDRPALRAAAETTAFPDSYLKRQANIAYMSSVYKADPEEFADVYDSKKEALARAELGKASVSDETLFEHFRSKFDNINQRNAAGRTLLENVARRTVEDLFYNRQNDSKKPLEEEMAQYADLLTPDDALEIRKRSDEITQSMRSAAPQVIEDARWLFERLGADTGIIQKATEDVQSGGIDPAMIVGGLSPTPAMVSTPDFDPKRVEEAIDKFAEMPDDRRQAVYNMAGSFATLFKADKGVFYQMAETMGRMATGTIKSTKGVTAETSLRIESQRIENGEPVLLDSTTGAMVAPVSEGYTGMNLTVPTQEQKQQRIADIKKQLNRIKVERELRNLAETKIDPITYTSTFLPNWAEEGLYGAASSVSYSAMAAIPYVGLPATALALYSQQYEEFMLEDPNMDPQKAMQMSAIAAPIRAFTERIQFLAAFGKALPFTSGLFKRLIKPEQKWLTRTMIMGAAGYTEQNIQELIENAVTPVVQTVFAALDEDIKDPDWKAKVQNLPREVAVNAVATLPLSLIGLGAIGYNEVKFGERYLYDKAIMERMGFSAEAADRVASQRDPEAAQEAFREEFANRDPAAVNAANSKLIEDMVQAGQLDSAIAMPSIEKQGEDYVVRKWNGEEVARTTDGEAAGYELQQLLVSQEQANWEALNMMVTALRKVKEERGISDQSVIELVDEGTLDAAANMTPEQLKLRLDALEKEMGVSLQPDQIRTVGLNIGELRDGIFRDVSRIVRSDDPDMVNVVIEETIEGDLKRAWNQNLFSKAQTVEWVRQYEQASGENLLADNFDALNEADQTSNLTEAMSTLGVAYFNGNIDRASIPQRLAQFFQRLLVYLQHIMARAVKLQAGLQSGQIDARLEQFFAESLGISIDTVIDSQTRQAQTEILDTETTAAIRADDTRTRGININDSEQDFTGQILRGEKTIETRDAPTLSPYIGRRVALVSTGKGGTPSIVGYAVVGEPKVYNTVDEFRADYDQHRVEPNSTFDIKPDGIKYGYPLTEVQAVEPTPVNVPVGRIATILDNATAAIRPTSEMLEQMAAPASETGVEIPDTVDKAALLENLFNIAQGQSWQRGRDLKQAMQQALLDEFKKAGVTVPIPSKEVAESPEATTYLVRVGLRDALLALRQNSNAIGWYDVKTRQALAVMALIHPEIERDENARFAMTWAMAVTSNGLKVGKNFELAEQVYSSFKANGVMPTDIGIGQAAGAINEGLGLFNTLRAEWGADNLRQFMQTRFTVQEISGLSPDLTPSGEHAATMVRGSAILGPKIGNEFFSNLYGYFDALTMDRWLVRTWGRWTGTLIVRDEARIVSGRTTLRDALAKTDVAKLAEGLRSLKKVTKTKGETELKPKDRERLIAAMEGLTESDDSVDELANAIQKASMDKQFRDVMNSVEGGSDLRKTGNNLAKEIDGQKEAPDGPHERNYIRHVFGQILAELKAMPEYAELTMADLQAVLWYAEKRLYETAKEDEDTDSNVEGYEDDEAPDYANAAAGVARAKGVSERKIKKALNDELTATTRPESQSQAAGKGEQGKVGGFTPTQKKLFTSAVGVRRIRLGRRTSERISYSYNRETGRDGKSARVLKNLGVSYTAEWKAGPAFRRILKATSPDAVSKGQDVAPLFYELEQTPQNAARFAELITASKTSNKFGASVYVYPADDYAKMQLFVTKDGLSGVGVKPDGDIVSVFSTGGAGRAIIELAVAAGGTKLDAFETILPKFYSAHGFVAVSRLKWDDSQAPDGWDKTLFREFNNGEPDVVFMAHDSTGHAWHSPKDGKVFTDYGKAVKAQEKAVGEFQKQAQIVTAAVRPATGDTLRDRLAQMDGDPKFRRERVAAALKKFKSIRDRFSQKRPDDPLSQIEAVAYLEALISMLPPEARKNIGGAEKLAGYKTARGRMNYLLKRIERTDKALEAYLRGAYIEEINELVENLSDTTDKNRTNRSRIGPEAQRIVNYIASVIDLEQKDVANKITGIQAQMNDPEATPEMLAQLQEEWALLDRYGALASADQHSAESLAQSYESLRSVILRGRDQWKAQEKLRLEEYERIRNEAQTELNQNVPTGALPSQLQKSKEESVTWWSKAQNYLEGHLAWYQHLRKIFGEGKLANQYETRVRRATNAFEDAQIQAKNNFRLVMIQRMGIGDKINLKTMAALNDALQKLNETRQSKAVIYEGKQVKVERIPMQTAIAAIFENKGNALGFDREELFRLNAELSAIPAGNIARRKFIELERVVSNGVPREQRLSELEAIQDILMWSQDDVRVKMERQGYTQDYIDSLSQDFLSNNGQIMLDYLRSQYSQGYDRVNAVYRRIYGMDMPRVRNYAPTAYDTAQTDTVMGPDEMSPSLTGMNAGFVKQRVSHNAPILRMNALSVFQSHMVTQNYWINFAELVRELRGTIASTDVVRAIKARVGEADAERMKKWILAFDRNGLDSGKMLEVVSDMLNRQMGLQAVMFMGYALSTLFKQGSAGMAISLDIGVDEYLRGLTKFFRGQLSASLPEIWNSPTIQRRIEAGYSPEARAVNQSAGMSPSKLLALAERGMLNIAQLDAFLTTFGAAIAFDHHYNAALAQGLSKEAAKSIALDRMDASVRRTAQPASLTDRSLLEANRSPFVRLLYLFASEPRQKFAINYMIAREIAAGRDVKRNLKKFAAGWVAMGVITEALTDIFQSIFRDDDEQEIVRWEDYARAAVMGHLNGLFLAGPALAMAGNAVFGSPVFNSSENPLVRIPTLVMRKDFKPWNWEDASDVVKGIQSYAQLTATVTGSMAVASVAAMLNIAKDAAGLWDKMTKDEE